jgi:DNA-binding IclR family transcriptional regulator
MKTSSATQQREVATSFLKGLDLLTVLARHPEGLAMPALRLRLKLPRTSIFRMLSTVELYGLIARKGNRWCTTERFHDWCSRDMHREIKERYHESLRIIAAEVDELVELGVGEGGGVRYIDWVQAGHPIMIDPLKSSLYPLHQTATGKLLLSQRPDLCEGIRERRLMDEIAAARVNGVAWNRRESDPNITAVATWVGTASTVTPVICVKWPFFRFTEAKARQALAVIRRTLARL